MIFPSEHPLIRTPRMSGVPGHVNFEVRHLTCLLAFLFRYELGKLGLQKVSFVDEFIDESRKVALGIYGVWYTAA